MQSTFDYTSLSVLQVSRIKTTAKRNRMIQKIDITDTFQNDIIGFVGRVAHATVMKCLAVHAAVWYRDV